MSSKILVSTLDEAAYVSEIALKSLLFEAAVTPKPGLVDRYDSGSHSDMDFFTFMSSAASLGEHFKGFFLSGANNFKLSPPELLAALREPGMKAERHMLRATSGVNTHKGVIYSMGMLCGALGWHLGNELEPTAENLLSFCGEMAEPSAERELCSSGNGTGGERMFKATGNGGARSEAAAGFPSVRLYALPALYRALGRGLSINDAGVAVLLEILCCVKDSNVFSRGGAKKQDELAMRARRILERESLDLSEVEELNSYCVRENISPGGCADLLVVTFFLYFYFH